MREDYEKAADDFAFYDNRQNRNYRPYSPQAARKLSGQEKHQKQQTMKTTEAAYQKKKDDIVKSYEHSLEADGYVKKTKPKERFARKSSDSYDLIDTLKNDAKSAKLDDLFTALEKASKETSDAYKAAEKKYNADKERAKTHATSLVGRMPYDDPAYKAAVRKESDIEDILNRILYK